MLKRNILVLMALVALVGTLIACSSLPQQPSSRTAALEAQETIAERASRAVEIPQPNNFLTRKTVAKWVDRQDIPERPYYVYLLGDNGTFIGYYVAQSRPVNTCTFLTPPDRVVGGKFNDSPMTVVQSPALDGVYYGSGGSCDQWFFFDAATDAMIEITGFKVFTSDQPLLVDAEPLRVATE
jgi:hypothetical protein